MEQMTFSDMPNSTIILYEDVEKAKKKADKLHMARSKALHLINDAKSRYVKEKTRARSKKAAEEKDAYLNSPHFAKLKDYEREQDIIDAYGYDMITEAESDALIELWREREAIKAKTFDGVYNDEATDALRQAYAFVAELWEDELDAAYMLEKDFKKQRLEAEIGVQEFMNRVNRDYEAMVRKSKEDTDEQ